MRTSSISLAFFALLVPLAAAQTPLDLVKHVAANYSALPQTSYDFDEVEVTEFVGGPFDNRIEQHWRIAGNGGKVREEQVPGGQLFLSDGRFRWTYNPSRNEYTRINGIPSDHPSRLSMLTVAAYQAKLVRILRKEKVAMAGDKIMCDVVEVEKEPSSGRVQYSPITYWIDAKRNLVLKMNYRFFLERAGEPKPSESVVTVSFNKAVVGQPVEEALFQFTPPPGAVEVQRMTFGPKSPLVGQDSPEFQLQAADGTTITGASLRGKMVLLQFGASADGHVLPILEMTYRSLKPKGLAAFYVLPPRFQPDKFSHAYSVPVAIDSAGAMAKKFGMEPIGTVLIDQQGKVVYADSTSSNWLGFADALQHAGVW